MKKSFSDIISIIESERTTRIASFLCALLAFITLCIYLNSSYDNPVWKLHQASITSWKTDFTSIYVIDLETKELVEITDPSQIMSALASKANTNINDMDFQETCIYYVSTINKKYMVYPTSSGCVNTSTEK